MNDLEVIPCSAADALAWARGEKSDEELLPAKKPEAIFFKKLESLAAYRRGIRLVRHFYRQGAVCMVARPMHPVVENFLQKHKAVATLKETAHLPDKKISGKRYIMLPENFSAWMRKVNATSRHGEEN